MVITEPNEGKAMNEYSNPERAEILTQALPYIQRYTGKVVVVKYGGNAMINEELKQQVMEDIVLLWLIGVKVVLVHGGGPEITDMMNKLGKKSEFVDGLRVTDEETIEIVQMVLTGKVNKSLVNLLELKGGKAIGLSGTDARLIEASMKDERLGFVGDVTKINIDPVTGLLERGYIPVISTIGCDKEGNVYNINGDMCEMGREVNCGSAVEVIEAQVLIQDFAIDVLGMKRQCYVIYANNKNNLSNQKHAKNIPVKNERKINFTHINNYRLWHTNMNLCFRLVRTPLNTIS